MRFIYDIFTREREKQRRQTERERKQIKTKTQLSHLLIRMNKMNTLLIDG